jgi:hypothetical protein
MTMTEHANGARSAIAKAVSGSQEPSDSWYEAAAEILEELSIAGFVVAKAEDPRIPGIRAAMERIAFASDSYGRTPTGLALWDIHQDLDLWITHIIDGDED